MSEWIKLKSPYDLPKKPGRSSYEHVECLVYHNDNVKILMWNCEHLVWDGEDGDDFFCAPMAPRAYMVIDRESLRKCLAEDAS